MLRQLVLSCAIVLTSICLARISSLSHASRTSDFILASTFSEPKEEWRSGFRFVDAKQDQS